MGLGMTTLEAEVTALFVDAGIVYDGPLFLLSVSRGLEVWRGREGEPEMTRSGFMHHVVSREGEPIGYVRLRGREIAELGESPLWSAGVMRALEALPTSTRFLEVWGEHPRGEGDPPSDVPTAGGVRFAYYVWAADGGMLRVSL